MKSCPELLESVKIRSYFFQNEARHALSYPLHATCHTPHITPTPIPTTPISKKYCGGHTIHSEFETCLPIGSTLLTVCSLHFLLFILSAAHPIMMLPQLQGRALSEVICVLLGGKVGMSRQVVKFGSLSKSHSTSTFMLTSKSQEI